MEEAVIHIQLTDERGWQKPFEMKEGIFWVGSAENAQIRLPKDPGIAAHHLQIVNMHNDMSVRVINLANSAVIYQKGIDSRLLEPNQIVDIYGPEVIRIGEYTLRFNLDKLDVVQPLTQENKQPVIGVRLVLSDVVLRPGTPIQGTVFLQNLGKLPCQFKMVIEGLPPECYTISPPPLINPGGEESTTITIEHKLQQPLAGAHRMILRVTAPDVYPTTEAAIQQDLRVLPYYQHELSFVDPASVVIPTHEPASEPVQKNQAESADWNEWQPLESEDHSEEMPNRLWPANISPENESTRSQSEPSQAGEEPMNPLVEDRTNPEDPSSALTPETLSPAEPAAVTAAPVEVEDLRNFVPPARRSSPQQPDLSAVKVLKANSGEFLEKRNQRE